MPKTLHDGTEVSDDTPTRVVNGERHLIEGDDLTALEQEQAEAIVSAARRRTMTDLRARLRNMLAAGLPHTDGRVYPATELDQQNIAAIQTGIASGQGLPLGRATLGKSHTAGVAELNAEEWTALATAMRDFITRAVEAMRAHAVAIASYETAEEIEGHDVTADIPGAEWPTNAL